MATHAHEKKSTQGSFAERAKQAREQTQVDFHTGGGEPIPKGQKMTDQKRAQQPIDPKTGRFTYNADGGMTRKYEYHGQGDADPLSLNAFILNSGVKQVKEGDVVNIDGETWIAIADIGRDEWAEMLKKIGQGGKMESNVGDATTDDMFLKKRGAKGKAEKAGIEKGRFIVGHYDMSKLGKTQAKQLKEKYDRFQSYILRKYDDPRVKGKPEEPKAPKGPKEAPKAPEAPKTPEGPKEEPKAETPESSSDMDSIKSDPDGYYQSHKAGADSAAGMTGFRNGGDLLKSIAAGKVPQEKVDKILAYLSKKK